MASALLINSNRLKQPWPVIPLGLCCVAGAAEAAGHEAHVLDLCFSNDCGRDIAAAIRAARPHVIGIGIRNIDNAAGYHVRFLLDKVKHRVVAPCKERFSGPIVIGGPAVGISAAAMLDFFDLEYAIRGDGERSFTALLDRLARAAPLEGLPGLVIRRGGRIIQDSPPAQMDDLDALPFARPHRRLDPRPYRRFNSPLQIQTKRGCALDCVYCTYNTIEGRRYRLREPGRIADEVETLVRETGINHFEFTDSTFNIPLDHAKEVLRAIAAKRMNLRLQTMGLNPSAIDEELVELMQITGFIEVHLGVEAGCDRTLASLGKNFRVPEIERAGRLLHAHRIPVLWFLLLGAPDETPTTVRETLETITRFAAPWDLITVGVGIRVYKGAPIAERMLAVDPHCTTDDFLHPVAFEPPGISLREIRTMVSEAALRQPNLFMYDESDRLSVTILRLGSAFLRVFAPRQPLWRMMIPLRNLERLCGLSALRRRRTPAGNQPLPLDPRSTS